ncbi:MFS transporter [Cellvibrio zantedeschiae]|uniref:MFS transporter n=1 Tax=Cellvibrio zantedeschiae TaxID=1237077 RepID=A0ABQ3BCW2_9GAMM|nr:MFS transporter [Cellvibrio zantedeschiae]GGY84602.1 MFS transporter [Cellvibrio zantedeschiae]
MLSPDQPATRLATRLAFLVAGFGYACWAPLVPFAQKRLGVDDGILGLLLLCIGAGSIAAMLVTGPLSSRYGSKPIIVVSGFGLLAILPFLPIVDTPIMLGLSLLVFGASLGSLDVAMNVHAVEVERASGKPLMSGFHGLFSVGAFAGAGLMTFLLSINVNAFLSTLLCSALMVIAMLLAWPRLLTAVKASDGPLFVLPKGFVLVLAGLAAATFLVEGALLDWGALLIIGKGQVSEAQGGLGYMIFSIAMIIGRFSGDAITARLGDKRILFWGGIIAVTGFVFLLMGPNTLIAMSGFLLIGLGASNIVPVLFRRAGNQNAMPAALAVGAMTTMGYAGILAGPACVGFVAQAIGLASAFWILAGLMTLVPLCARMVTRA